MDRTASTRRLFLWRSFAISVMPWTSASGSVLQKTIDKRVASEAGEYAIGFASKATSGGYDHAFVVWYYSDPKGFRTVRRCAGFYPVSDHDTKWYDVVLGITGKVFDDSKVKIDRELTILVNQATFEKAILIEERYKVGHTYRLAFDDCTTFVKSVADTLPGVAVPSRVTHIYPSDFISALYDSN